MNSYHASYRQLFFVAAALLVLSVGSCHGQCLTGDCGTPPASQPIPIPSIVDSLVTQSAHDGPSSPSAVRVRSGGGCGSGSVVGHHNGNSLIMTNAHVAGTQVGRVVQIDAIVDGKAVTVPARLIMAAYSDRTLADWAVVQVDNWTPLPAVPMSTKRPTGSHYTKGSPRCVWPLTSTDITTADMSNNSPLWRWRPNAIGGQSGSAIWSDDDDEMYGLLTWSWGGLGAGQMTSEIYRQAANKTTAGEPRVDGLVELSNPVAVENGFFVQAGINDLPIWSDGSTPPVDPVPVPDVSERESELLASLKARSAEVGVDYEKTLSLMIGGQPTAAPETEAVTTLRQRAAERNIDFIRLIELILQIFDLFRS